MRAGTLPELVSARLQRLRKVQDFGRKQRLLPYAIFVPITSNCKNVNISGRAADMTWFENVVGSSFSGTTKRHQHGDALDVTNRNAMHCCAGKCWQVGALANTANRSNIPFLWRDGGRVTFFPPVWVQQGGMGA